MARAEIAPYLLVSLALHGAALTLWSAPTRESIPAGRSFFVDLMPAMSTAPTRELEARMRTPEPPRPARPPAQPGLVKSKPEPRAPKPAPKAAEKPAAPAIRSARAQVEPAAPARNTAVIDTSAHNNTAAEDAGGSTVTTTTTANTTNGRNTHTGNVPPETATRLYLDLREALGKHFHYPLVARRKGLAGEVKLRLRIEPDGELTHIRVQESSGHAMLDEAAIATLNKVARLPQAAQWLKGAYFDVTLPVEYRLIDG